MCEVLFASFKKGLVALKDSDQSSSLGVVIKFDYIMRGQCLHTDWHHNININTNHTQTLYSKSLLVKTADTEYIAVTLFNLKCDFKEIQKSQ